jgi:hypothetical protein
MICDHCKQEHDGKYGSGRFCNQSCSNSFSSNKKTEKTYIKIGDKLRGKTTKFKGSVLPRSIYEITCIKCGNLFSKELAEQYYKTNRYLKICNNCSIDKNKSHEKSKNKDDWKMLCGKNSLKTKLYKASLLSFEESTDGEKRRRILKNQDGKCFICKTDSWNGKPLVLQLHHVDGNKNNNSEKNLQYLCPNCHSQTDNYTSKNSFEKKKDNITNEEFIEALKSSDTIHQTLIKLNLCEKGANYNRAYRLLKNIDIKSI